MKVGIFDSGVGGITVLKEAMDKLPSLDYIYYSDNLHVPYGTKDKKEVLGYVRDIVCFLISQQVDAILIACNTATSIAVRQLRKEYSIPIIGMEPAVKLALDHVETGKVLVTATPLTLKEEKYKQLVNEVDDRNRVHSLALPELVTFAEALMFNERKLESYFKEQFSKYNLEEYGGLVLGCTHFVYFKKYLEKFLPHHIKIFDGNKGTINYLEKLLRESNGAEEQLLVKGQVTFYYSGQEDKKKQILNRYLECL